MNQYTDVLAKGSGKEETYSKDTDLAVENLERDFSVVSGEKRKCERKTARIKNKRCVCAWVTDV